MSTQGHSIRIGQLEICAEERGEGSPALVFIHYWGGSRRTWSAVIERLRHRFRCIAVDLRGWGKSGRQADDYSLFAQADDVKGVIEALKVKDFVLVGHSMGGKIAQILAGQRPEGLRAVVPVAPAPPTPLLGGGGACRENSGERDSSRSTAALHRALGGSDQCDSSRRARRVRRVPVRIMPSGSYLAKTFKML
jgi:pimeloyl-ACP methyl ester carboxylesterase